MTVVLEYAKRQVECDDCGRITEIPKWMRVRDSWCKECRSLKIRLYKPRKAKKKR